LHLGATDYQNHYTENSWFVNDYFLRECPNSIDRVTKK